VDAGDGQTVMLGVGAIGKAADLPRFTRSSGNRRDTWLTSPTLISIVRALRQPGDRLSTRGMGL
jgi:hypothetical protein